MTKQQKLFKAVNEIITEIQKGYRPFAVVYQKSDKNHFGIKVMKSVRDRLRDKLYNIEKRQN